MPETFDSHPSINSGDQFTPTGETLVMALTGIRLFVIAIDAGDMQRAESIVNGPQPEPEGDRPSIAQVTATCLSHLDAWHTDPERDEALAAARVAPWHKRSRVAATDILALAQKGRAFDSIGSLLARFTEAEVLQGGMLAVAASLQSQAAFEETTIRAVGVRNLG
ncbi:hypothetical protein ACWPKO_25685 (plasmid) [Coraliomargarita sp. W4R53]